MKTSDFIELHRVTDFTPSAMQTLPVVINKRHILYIRNAKTFGADWDICGTKIIFSNDSMIVTESYEEVKAMLL